jgi:hypothetical protein
MRWVRHVACIGGGGRGKEYTGFWWGNLRERDHLEYPCVDGRILLKWICMKWDGEGGMDLIDLVQARDRWWTLVNVAKNLRVP